MLSLGVKKKLQKNLFHLQSLKKIKIIKKMRYKNCKIELKIFNKCKIKK